MLTTVDLIRHAHADWTPDENRPLSARGRMDAEALGRRLAAPAIAAIYSSPARRAIETVEPLATACGLAPVVVDDLRERELVVPDGLAFEAAVAAAWANPDERVHGSESNSTAAARGRCVMALVLNALDPAFGPAAWRALTFPDVWRLTFHDDALTKFARVAGSPTAGA